MRALVCKHTDLVASDERYDLSLLYGFYLLASLWKGTPNVNSPKLASRGPGSVNFFPIVDKRMPSIYARFDFTAAIFIDDSQRASFY